MWLLSTTTYTTVCGMMEVMDSNSDIEDRGVRGVDIISISCSRKDRNILCDIFNDENVLIPHP